jgi:hypothetical protein
LLSAQKEAEALRAWKFLVEVFEETLERGDDS